MSDAHGVTLWLCCNKQVIKEQKECSMDTANMVSVRHCEEGSRCLSALRVTRLPAIRPVFELRKGVTGRNNLQAGQAAAFCEPPGSPSPSCAVTNCHGKKLPFAHCGLVADFMFCLWACFISMHWGLNSQMWRCPACTAWQRDAPESQTAHHWMLLLSSVPFASDIFIFPMEWPTWFTPSLRGGMRSLMRSRPLASSKLVILCCGENPRMAKKEKMHKGIRQKWPWYHFTPQRRNFGSQRQSRSLAGRLVSITSEVRCVLQDVTFCFYLHAATRQTLQRSRLSLDFVQDKDFKKCKKEKGIFRK